MCKLFLLLVLLAASTTGTPQVSVTGNYEFEVRHAEPARGEPRILLSGTVVLDSQSFNADDIDEPESCCLDIGHKLLLEPFNGCFVLESHGAYHTEDPQLVEVLTWSTEPSGNIAIVLFQGVDAGYIATVRESEAGLAGTAARWHAMLDVDEPPDTVVMRRVGEPDLTPCLDAARARVPVEAALEDILKDPEQYDGKYVITSGVAEFECRSRYDCDETGHFYPADSVPGAMRHALTLHTRWLAEPKPRHITVHARFFAATEDDTEVGHLRSVTLVRPERR